MLPRFSLALLAVLLACAPAAARAGWFNSDWKRRQLIRINDDTDGGLAYYQTRIVVAHRPGVPPDFADARFTDTDGAVLNHWLGSFVPSESAVFWVRSRTCPRAPGRPSTRTLTTRRPGRRQAGRPVKKIVLFNLRSELAPFRRTVVGALNAGAYKPSDIIYNCEDFRAMKDRDGLARNFDGSPRVLALRPLPGLAPDAGF